VSLPPARHLGSRDHRAADRAAVVGTIVFAVAPPATPAGASVLGIAIVAGQGLWWGSRRILVDAAALAAAFHAWVRVYEEPRLRDRFGATYVHDQREVPRWLPRPGAVNGRRRGPSARRPR
jgi:hypothetical protein